MARKRRDQQTKSDSGHEETHHPRPFWSGVIAFGLVSLPVSLFPANRGRSTTLSMADDKGTRLRRRFFNDQQDRMLQRDDLVRGYPVEKDRFILVEDEELEALAPEKTREIDLKRFVPLDQINPVFFERGYFLTPDSDATKAYRLLARALEEEQRAGIATFVMRDREYLVAIMSEAGILRAETLRFHDEVRSPQEVGLTEGQLEAEKTRVQEIRRAMKARYRKTLDPDLLVERQTQALKQLVDRKLDRHQDVIATEAPAEEPVDEDNVVDLMQILKERLRGDTRPSHGGEHVSGTEAQDLSRDELYKRAQEKGIAGRSKMSKRQLAQALRKAG